MTFDTNGTPPGPTPAAPKIESIAEALLDAGIGIREAAPHHARLVRSVYRELAKGSPIAVADLERLARASDVSLDLARAAAARWLDFDGVGNLVGFGGLTLRSTNHRVVLDDETSLYLWCVLDGFLIAHALGQAVRILTRCRATDEPIAVAATSASVEEVEPATAVMSIVTPAMKSACSVEDTRKGFCEFVNFYASEKAALDAMKDSEAAIVSMEESLRLAGLLTLPLRNAV